MVINGSKILIKALKVGDKWIPIWEFQHEVSEMYGDIYFLNGKSYEFSSIESFHDVYYDINTKEISSGIKVDIYPTSTEYKKGDTVFVSSSGSRSLIKGKISELVYISEYHKIMTGRESKEEGYDRYVTNIDPEALYHFIIYKVHYKIEGSEDTYWPHQIYVLKPE
jgi:hypothetical protein